jgi:superfamily I DNA/RNA helicase
MKRLKIFGPPGTGKTKTLLDYLNDELKSIPSHRIAFLTFTRTAKGEALERTGKTPDQLPYLRTIHSICFRQMGMSREQMVQIRDLQGFGTKIGKKISGFVPTPWGADELLDYSGGSGTATAEDILLQLNHLGRHRKIGLKESLRGVDIDVDFLYAKWFTEEYRRWRDAESLIDYTDILTEYLKTGSPLPIDVLFIDECQDLSKLQWEVIHKLGANAQRWYLAGDDDQAIFQWAGASADQFNREICDSNQFLEQSYRLPRTVLNLSERVVNRIHNRTPKILKPRDADGAVQVASYITPNMLGSDNLVLFRNHYCGKMIGDEFMKYKIPYSGPHSPLSRPETKIFLQTWQKVLKDEVLIPKEIQSLIRSVGSAWLLPSHKEVRYKAVKVNQILKKVPHVDQWREAFKSINQIDYISDILKRYGLDAAINPPTQLMSIHQSKGKQAEKVFVNLLMSAKTYDAYSKDGIENREDEHRVWYVGVTRAKEELTLIVPESERRYNLG